MSDSFTNGHVAGLSCIKIHSLLPHIAGTVHSNIVICLDIDMLRSFLQGKSMLCSCFFFYSIIKMFPTAKYVGRQPRGDYARFLI